MDQVIVQTNLVPVELDYDQIRIFTFHDLLLLLLKNRRKSKQNGKEEYLHFGTDYTRLGQQGKANIDDQPAFARNLIFEKFPPLRENLSALG